MHVPWLLHVMSMHWLVGTSHSEPFQPLWHMQRPLRYWPFPLHSTGQAAFEKSRQHTSIWMDPSNHGFKEWRVCAKASIRQWASDQNVKRFPFLRTICGTDYGTLASRADATRILTKPISTTCTMTAVWVIKELNKSVKYGADQHMKTDGSVWKDAAKTKLMFFVILIWREINEVLVSIIEKNSAL